MKKIRILFALYLIVHLACLLLVNIFLPKGHFLKNKELNKELNTFGKYFLNLQIDSIPKYIQHPVKSYTNLTGTDSGYGFFSPNVSNGSSKFIFISEKGREIKLLKSIESQIKLATITSRSKSFISDEKKRNGLLKSICSRLFTLNPQIKEISVFLEHSKYDKLKKSTPTNYTIDSEKIELAKIKRNEN